LPNISKKQVDLPSYQTYTRGSNFPCFRKVGELVILSRLGLLYTRFRHLPLTVLTSSDDNRSTVSY